MPDLGDNPQPTYIATQSLASSSILEEAEAGLQCYPPLGQVTPVESNEIALTAVLEVPSSAGQTPWEVSIWHSVDEAEWSEAGLYPVDVEQQPLDLQVQSDTTSRIYFAIPLSFQKSVRFTLKFRQEGSDTWRWARDEQGLSDGLVVTTAAAVESEKLTDLISDLDKQWHVSARMSQAPRSRLWSLENTIAAADGDLSSFKDISIGTPWGSFLR